MPEKLKSADENDAVSLVADSRLPSPPTVFHSTMTDEKRRHLLVLLKQWAEEDANATPEEIASTCEFVIAFDESRPHRPVFTEYIKQLDEANQE